MPGPAGSPGEDKEEESGRKVQEDLGIRDWGLAAQRPLKLAGLGRSALRFADAS